VLGQQCVAVKPVSSQTVMFVAELHISVVAGRAFDYLDAPVVRLTGVDVPMPYAKLLEQNAVPQVVNITESVKRLLNIKQLSVGKKI